MISTKYLIVVGGPTASGKTSLGIALAKHFDTVVLSADSRQFYTEMKIGNARPTDEELAAVPHFFVAHRSVTEPLSAGAFAREAGSLLKQLYQQHDHVVLVGGSGLFIKALTQGLDEFPEVKLAARQQVDDWMNTQGLPRLLEELEARDPAYYEQVDRQNPMRIRRALEVCLSGEQPYSSYLNANNKNSFFSPIYLQPTWPRELLYERINTRVVQMLTDGLEAEARALLPHQLLASVRTVGYQEWWPYFAGARDMSEVVNLIQQNSRRYAKRQLTWNRGEGHWKSVPQGDLRTALAYIELVKKQDFVLQKVSFSDNNNSHLLHRSERKAGLRLVDGSGKEQASIDWYALRDWAFIYQWQLSSSHLANSAILHEAVHRTEVGMVYHRSFKEEETLVLEQAGWKRISPEELPAPLRPHFRAEVVGWLWRRD